MQEEYEKRIAEREPESGEGSNSQQSDNNIFLDVVGGPNKKGRIYGLGSQAVSIVASSSKSSFVPVEGVTPEEVTTMKATIQALKDQIQQKDQKWQELQDELQQKDQKWQESLQDQLQKRDQEWEQRFPSMMEKYWQQKFAGLMLGPMRTRPSQQGALQLPPTLEDDHDNDSDGVDSDE